MKKLLSLLFVLQVCAAHAQFYYTPGCTDPNASNYSGTSDAYEYGTCCYETSMSVLYSVNGYVVVSNSVSSFNETFGLEDQYAVCCLSEGCYDIEIGAFGFCQFYFELSDGQVFNYTLQSETINFQITVGEPISGCNDPSACNYNPTVNCTLEDCNYDCVGCTDPQAQNYDPNATIDSGTCIVDTYTLTISTECEWSVVNNNYSYLPQSGLTSGGIAQFTVSGDCNYLTIYLIDYDTPATYNVTNGNGDIVAQGSIDLEFYPATIYLCYDLLIGCMDEHACNYDPNAVCSNPLLCEYDCVGCTDPTAINYDPNATIESDACCYEYLTFVLSEPVDIYCTEYGNPISSGSQGSSSFDFCYRGGCIQVISLNSSLTPFSLSIFDSYGELLQMEEAIGYGSDGITEYQLYFQFVGESIPGCDDEFACNYNPQANCYDHTCDYSCHGCTDPSAPNYNAEATMENGSCCEDSWYTFDFSEPCFWYVQNISTGLYAYGNYPEDNGFCASQFTLPIVPQMPVLDEHISSYVDRSSADCFEFHAYSLSGNALEYTLSDNNGQVIASSIGENGLVATELASNNDDISGCMDMNACNYNPSATCHSGNCEYECGGCTDNSAINYSASALWEDGSCFYTLQAPEVTYQIVNGDNGTSYSVIFTINDFGNGEQYIISSDYNTEQIITSGSNTYEMGPFACFSEINFKFRSTMYNLVDYLNIGPISHNCTIISTDEITTEQPFGLYPNPTNGLITLSGLQSGKSEVFVYDMTGRVVSEFSLQGQNSVDISDLSNGYYIMKMKNSGKTQTQAFIKE